jgi:hypothetical protein
VGSIRRLRARFPVGGRVSEAAGIEVAVAITRLAKHSASISLFVRFVKFLFSYFIRPLGALAMLDQCETGQVTLATAGARGQASGFKTEAILIALTGS